MDASKYNGSKLKWILKLDDDVLLDINELKQFTENLHEKDFNTIFCHVMRGYSPHRNKGSKWFVNFVLKIYFLSFYFA